MGTPIFTDSELEEIMSFKNLLSDVVIFDDNSELLDTIYYDRKLDNPDDVSQVIKLIIESVVVNSQGTNFDKLSTTILFKNTFTEDYTNGLSIEIYFDNIEYDFMNFIINSDITVKNTVTGSSYDGYIEGLIFHYHL